MVHIKTLSEVQRAQIVILHGKGLSERWMSVKIKISKQFITRSRNFDWVELVQGTEKKWKTQINQRF